MSEQTHSAALADPLPELEADLAAVDAALASLDRIDLEGRTGDSVVAEIRAVVDPQRFGQPVPGSDLVGNGLDGEQVDPLADTPGPS